MALVFNTGSDIWANVDEVAAAEVVVISEAKISRRKYWEVEGTQQPWKLSTEQTVSEAERLTISALEAQLYADVPVGSMLSGGLDSSLVSAVAAKHFPLSTFTIDYIDQAHEFTGDELRVDHDTPFAAETAAFLATNHDVLMMDPEQLMDGEYRRAVVRSRDSPIGVGDMDTSLFLLFRHIAQQNKVFLSGEGADEIFAGYPWFNSTAAQEFSRFPWTMIRKNQAALPLAEGLLPQLAIQEIQESAKKLDESQAPTVYGDNSENTKRRQLQYISLKRWLGHAESNRSTQHGQ